MKRSSMRRAWTGAATLILAVGAAAAVVYHASSSGSPGAAGIAGRRSGSMKSWFITYKRPMAPPGLISQIITQTQGCLLTVTGSIVGVDLPDLAEIGKYRRPCSADETEPLKRLADAAIAEAAKTKDVDSPRGTRFLTFGTGEVGGDVEKLASYPLSMAFPPPIQQFDEAMVAAARKSLETRAATLAGRAVLGSPVLTPQQDFRLSIVLRNSGTVRVLVHNPAAAEKEEQVGLELAISKDASGAGTDEGEPEFVRVSKGEVVRLRAPGGQPVDTVEPYVRLEPGQDIVLQLTIKRHVYSRPGSYTVRVTYDSLTDKVPEEEAVHGVLSIPAGSFVVKARL